MSEVYKFLADEEELKWFWKFGVPPLKPYEVYFISTSARNKRLNPEEREHYQVGRSEMWHKEIIAEDDYARFIKAIRRCECNKEAYLTKAGLSYPDCVLVLYYNVVPSNAYRAMQQQMIYLMDLQKQLTDAVVGNSEGGIEACYKNIRHCHTTGQSVFARSFSDAVWVDIDMDCKPKPALEVVERVRLHLLDQLDFSKGDFMIIDTAGGDHIMFRSAALKAAGARFKGDPVKKVIDGMSDVLQASGLEPEEIVRNKNEMVALPGTLQYGDHIVRVLNKEDFTEDMKMHDMPITDSHSCFVLEVASQEKNADSYARQREIEKQRAWREYEETLAGGVDAGMDRIYHKYH
jgi:hypothetical protein